MKKETADKLAYSLVLASFSHSAQKINQNSAVEVSDFIRVVSAEFQTHLSDFESSAQGD